MNWVINEIVVLEGKVYTSVYLKMLTEYAIPEGNRIIGEYFIFQQEKKNITILKWPPQSSDFSKIENAWSMLKIRIAEEARQNLSQLKDSIISNWKKN